MSFTHSSQVLLGAARPAEIEPHVSDAPTAKIRVVIAMSGKLERLAWSLIIGDQQDMEMIAEVASGDEALAFLRTHESDVTLIDEAVLNSGEYKEFREYCGRSSSSRFVLATLHNVRESLELAGLAFIHSYILKGATADELLQAIRCAAVSRR